jgi:hypothetical protein
MILAASAGTAFLAVHTAWHLRGILAWPDPERSLKLVMAAVCILLAALYAALLLRDFRGRVVPPGSLLTPLWLVVGAQMLHAAFRHGVKPFFWIGTGAAAAGLWGLGILVLAWRGADARRGRGGGLL